MGGQIEHIAVGRGRGRGTTLPSWMTQSKGASGESGAAGSLFP
jgi:hypothetical protein